MRFSDYQFQNAWNDSIGAGGQYRDGSGYVLPAGSTTTVPCGPPHVCPLGSVLDEGVYTRDQVLGAITGLITRFNADSVSMQDATTPTSGASPSGGMFWDVGSYCVGPFADYSDHVYGAAFVLEAATRAQAAMPNHLSLRIYRDYTISQEPQNISDNEANDKELVFARYAIYDMINHEGSGFLSDGSGYLTYPFSVTSPYFSPDSYYERTTDADGSDGAASWQNRQFAMRTLVGTGDLSGRLQIGDQCLTVSGTYAAPGSCDSAPAWVLTTTNQIQESGGSQCLSAEVTGSLDANIPLVMGPCLPQSESNTFFVFADGQIRAPDARCLGESDSSEEALIYSQECGYDANSFDASSGGCPDSDVAVNASGHVVGYQNWTLIFDNSALVSTQFSNSSGVQSSPSYYQTFRIANQNICVRESSGLYCADFDGDSAVPGLATATNISSVYTDGAGWYPNQYGTTVMGIWDGESGSTVACARGIYGAGCGEAFSSASFADAYGWSSSDVYYDSVRYIDLYSNGRTSVCGRGVSGILCAVNIAGTSWSPASWWTSNFSDSAGWTTSPTGDTIQFGDINGDGNADVCGRSAYGMECAVMNPVESQFVDDHFWSFDEDRTIAGVRMDFFDSDLGGIWLTSPAYYDSIKLVDINRDGFADVCGRGPDGIYCAFSTGTAFEPAKLVEPYDFTDALGWSTPSSGSTITFGDLDGDQRVDVCGRGYYGVVCAEGY